MVKIKFKCGHTREVIGRIASEWKAEKKGRCLHCNKDVELKEDGTAGDY